MSYIGDFALGSTFDLKFTTVTSGGLGTLLTNTPAVVAYPDNSLSQISTGITLTTAFDGFNGLNNVHVVASGANGFAAGVNYTLVIFNGNLTTNTGLNVAGYVVGEFSIEARGLNLAQAEPGQGNPPASATLATKIAYLYKAWRNIKNQTATGWSLLGDDDVTVHQKTAVSDNGTTATKGKIVSGP